MTEQLTKSEALAKGYRMCGRDNGNMWQGLCEIESLSQTDFDFNGWLVASTDLITPSIDEDYIKERVADMLSDEWSSETGDDTNEVFNLIKEVDFGPITKAIKEKLGDYGMYQLTTIRIVQDAQK